MKGKHKYGGKSTAPKTKTHKNHSKRFPKTGRRARAFTT